MRELNVNSIVLYTILFKKAFDITQYIT